MPANDNTSKCFSFCSGGRISIASMFWQSSMYNSFRLDSSESANVLILLEVRSEHWLRFIDLSAGEEEISALIPTSESRNAPVRDRIASAGKHFGDRAKLACNTKSDKQRPH